MGGLSYSPLPVYGLILILFILSVNPYSGNPCRIPWYHHLNPKTGNDIIGWLTMDYSDIYVWRIRKLCKERGIAINKLAAMSDVKQSTLDNIVRGLTKNPRVKTLHKVAIAFTHYPITLRKMQNCNATFTYFSSWLTLWYWSSKCQTCGMWLIRIWKVPSFWIVTFFSSAL